MGREEFSNHMGCLLGRFSGMARSLAASQVEELIKLNSSSQTDSYHSAPRCLKCFLFRVSWTLSDLLPARAGKGHKKFISSEEKFPEPNKSAA